MNLGQRTYQRKLLRQLAVDLKCKETGLFFGISDLKNPPDYLAIGFNGQTCIILTPDDRRFIYNQAKTMDPATAVLLFSQNQDRHQGPYRTNIEYRTYLAGRLKYFQLIKEIK